MQRSPSADHRGLRNIDEREDRPERRDSLQYDVPVRKNFLSDSSDNPLVSVIVPVYNGEDFILTTIESALTQTWANLEVIVVDDGSSDNTRRLVEGRAASDSRLRVLHQTNGGVARARNHAIAVARGDFIAPLDADDLWEPSKIARQMQRMLECGDETAMIYTGWVWIDESGAIVDRSPRWLVEGCVFDMLLEINFTGNASVPLFRRRALEEIGGYNAALADARAGGCEDWQVALRIARRHRVAVVPEALVGYRRRPGSMSTACDTMLRSKNLVISDLQRSEPGISGDLLLRSERQFSLYLAGLAFWSGNFREAVSWGLRSGVRLPLAVLPHVAAMLCGRVLGHFRLMHARGGQKMAVGESLDEGRLPSPYIDYAHIYRKRTAMYPNA